MRVSIVKQAIWIIERHLDQNLTLPEIAAACGVTPSHLSHAFSQALGRTLTGYVRGRRLSRAAEHLSAGAPDILPVALEAGYGSHEAFSRAFGREFGRTPEMVRKAGTVEGLALTGAADMAADMEPGISLVGRKQCPAMRLIGLAARFHFDLRHDIPGLWQQFTTLYPLIEPVSSSVPVGLCGPFAEDGTFDYACAVEATGNALPPAGMAVIQLPAADYAIFRHQGHVSTIGGTYRRILDDALPQRGWTIPNQPIVERHDTGFDAQTGEGGVSIWVPVVVRS